MRSHAPIETLELIFNALGLSYINYGAQLIFNSNHQTQELVVKSYNKCWSVIFNVSMSQALQSDIWMPLRDHVISILIKFIRRALDNVHGCPALQDIIVHWNHQYNTRKSKLPLARINRKVGEMAFFSWAPRLLNDEVS